MPSSLEQTAQLVNLSRTPYAIEVVARLNLVRTFRNQTETDKVVSQIYTEKTFLKRTAGVQRGNRKSKWDLANLKCFKIL